MDDVTHRLLASMYRSGSQWLYFSFKNAYSDHKVFQEAPLDLFIGFDGIFCGFTALKWGPLMLDGTHFNVKAVHITRDPHDFARSAHNYGYKDASIALAQWERYNRAIMEMDVPLYKIEDLWADKELIHEVAAHLLLPHSPVLSDLHGKKIGAMEDGKIRAPKVPLYEFDLPKNVAALATELGYA